MFSTLDRRAWSTVALVFLFMLINYADKAVVGLSSVPIMRELGLSHVQFGMLGSAFFLLFSASGVAVGFLANRVRTKSIMGWMGVAWSAALLPMSVVSGFAALLTSRILLGAAEGPSFPVAVHAVYKWFGDRGRALPTSVVACGAAFGTGIVAPLITLIIVARGWHAAFGALGAVGLAWVCAWLWFGEEGPIGDPPAAAAMVIPYASLIFSRTAIGVYLAGFAAYWVIALNLVWLANYLIHALRMAPQSAAWVIALPSALQMVLAPCCAWLSQGLSARGVPSRISRGLFGALCVMISGISMILVPNVGMANAGVGTLEVLLIGVCFSIGSVIFTLGTTLIGEISPLAQRGAMLGMANSVHTLAGLCAPVAMGMLVDIDADPIAGFRTGFMAAGTLVAMMGFAAAVLIDPPADLASFRGVGIAHPP